MQTQNTSRNLAARAGRWSANHRKTAIFGWLAFVLIALVAGIAAGAKQIDNNSGPGETGRAAQDLNRAFPQDDRPCLGKIDRQERGRIRSGHELIFPPRPTCSQPDTPPLPPQGRRPFAL